VNEELQRLTPQSRARLARIDVEAAEAEDRAKSANSRLQAPFGPYRDATDILEAIVSDSRAKHAVLVQITNRIRQWLRDLSDNLILEDQDPLPPVETTADEISAAIVKVRARLMEVKQEAQRVSFAPLPKEAQVGLIPSFIAEQRARNRPDIRVTNGRLECIFTDPRKDFGVSEQYLMSMLAWLAPSAFAKRLQEDIEARPDVFSLHPDDKADRLEKLTRETDALERDEEALIQAAVKLGVDAARRFDASPPAVLSVKPVPKPSVIALPLAATTDDVEARMAKACDELTRNAIKRGEGAILTLDDGSLWKFRFKGPLTDLQKKAKSAYLSAKGKAGSAVSMANWRKKLEKDAQLERARAPFRLDRVKNASD
jgi:hypothetical protein